MHVVLPKRHCVLPQNCAPDEEIRFRIEELCTELDMGFPIQDAVDAEFTLYCYSDASDVALGSVVT